MEIMKLIKESLGIEGELDEKTAKEIIQSLDNDIQKAKDDQEQLEKERKADVDREWTDRVVAARGKKQSIIKARAKTRQVKGYSAGRLARLRRLGKID